jgi:hypothetical protein
MSESVSPEEVGRAIDRVVQDLFDFAGLREPPVDAVVLATRHMGLVLPGGRGRRPSQPGPEKPAQQQWAAAQEIGRQCRADVLSKLGVPPEEARGLTGASLSNLFAGRLLLPTAWFAAEGRAAGWDLPALKQRFGTAGYEVLAARLLDLDEPCVVTVVDNEHVQSRRSNAWPVNRTLSGPEQRCLRQVQQYSRPHRLSADGWTVQGWPVHEADWRREILRGVIDE